MDISTKVTYILFVIPTKLLQFQLRRDTCIDIKFQRRLAETTNPRSKSLSTVKHSKAIIMFLDMIPASWLCVVFVIVFVLCTQAGLIIFNFWYKRKHFPNNNEVGGLMFGTQSLIYSLILAFVIVAVWTDYEELNQTIEQEADKINSILSHSATLPNNIKEPLNIALSTYCKQIINKEWKMQDEYMELHPSAIPELRMMLLNLTPKNKTEEGIFSVLDEDLSSISDLRRERLDHTKSHVPNWYG